MESKQKLLDSLTSHISLYNSQNPTRNPNPNPNPQRSTLLRWFSSLSVHQRRAHLTTINRNFVTLLLQMNQKLQSHGPGRFIILPDLPQNDNHSLPTLCYRKCDGLLARFSELNTAERRIHDSVELFSSTEGETSASSSCLDAMSVGEGLVGDVDGFVEIVDEISNGEFLRGGEEGEVAAEWPEFGWLKGKGYYSLAEFVVNRLEVALRLAWLGCSSGKKRGVKLKERLSAAGLAGNLFWRKNGCVDWWEKLDVSVRNKLFVAYLGKAAKSLIVDILKGKDNGTGGKLWRCEYQGEQSLGCNSNSLGGRHFDTSNGSVSRAKLNVTCPHVSRDSSPLDFMLNSLYILQVISKMLLASQHGGYDKGKLFFSSLDLVNSISDIILRKWRALIMVISLDWTKLELLGDENTNPLQKKSNEKSLADKRKKKGKNRNKKSYPVPRPCNDDLKPDEHAKCKGDELLYTCKEEAKMTSNLRSKVLEKNNAQEGLLPTDVMEAVKGVNRGNLRSANRKNRKERKKLKSTCSNSSEVGDCQPRNTKFSSKDGPTKSDSNFGSSTTENMSNEVVIEISRTETNPNVCSNLVVDTVVQLADSDCSGEISNISLKHHQNSGNHLVQNHADFSGNHSLTCDRGSVATTIKPGAGHNDDMSTESYADLNRIYTKAGYFGKQTKGSGQEGKPDLVPERGSHSILRVGSISSPAYVSYEWPNIAPPHPSASTHLPAATDRLHLDVGHNWQNHFHHSFVQTLQVRKSPMENGYNGRISRPLPMSLDWPPTVRGVNGLGPPITCNYDWEFISRRQSALQQVTAQFVQCGVATSEDERTTSGDLMDFVDVTNAQEGVEDNDKLWMSEEESEAHAVSGLDYNQYFGGGVMYWDPSDHPGTSFSRPPSLCSDDSSWAWREADMNRAVDDMVAFSSSYSTNGLTSPSAASFCSPFDPLGSGTLGYVMPGNEASGKVLHSSATMTDIVAEDSVSGAMSNMSGDGEVKVVDSLPYPILRPIIIPSMSRERSRSDFKRNYDHKSPCVPPNRREQPRVKRPPSPVVLCVPRAPRPPPPSPAGDSRRHRGFPTVRSGSSSPRHWGVKGWLHDGANFEEAYMPMDGSEVVWPSWRSKGLSARQLTQPLAGAMLQDRLLAISQLARDQEHPDITFPLQPPESQTSSSRKAHLSVIHDILHEEIDTFGKQVAAENLIRKPYINWAVKRVARSLQVLWPRSRTSVFGSNATGLSLPSSDVDLVVCLPPVRNLEPIKEAGILEGRNGIKETCLQHAARYLANQEWVKSDSLKIVENTAIPIIMLVVEIPHGLISSAILNVQMPKEEADHVAAEEGNLFHTDAASSESSTSPKWSKITNDTDNGVKAVRLDISFKSPTHTGLQTTGLVKDLTERFPAIIPLALVLKQFLADRTLDQSYSGGLSSYCLILLITRFLQHEHHHGRSTNQNLGSLLMDFLYFFGNVFDPRQMRISVQGSGVYLKRERGCSIDPLYIDDPLFVTNNVGRNCFRIHQCIKAFADAYAMLENEITSFPDDDETDARPTCRLLPKIIPSLGHLVGP